MLFRIRGEIAKPSLSTRVPDNAWQLDREGQDQDPVAPVSRAERTTAATRNKSDSMIAERVGSISRI